MSESEKKKFDDEFDQLARTSAADAAKQIIKGIKNKKPRIRIGTDALLMDRLYRLMPVRAVSIFAKILKRHEDGKGYILNSI